MPSRSFTDVKCSQMDLRRWSRAQMEIGDTPYVVEVLGRKKKENLSRGLQPGLVFTSPPHSSSPHLTPPLSVYSHCLFEPASRSHRPSLITEDRLAQSLGQCPACPVLFPRLGEAQPVLQPWHRPQALLGMDAGALRANLVDPAFLYSVCVSVCVCVSQSPDLPHINKLPIQFLFIALVCVVTPKINYTPFLSLLSSLFVSHYAVHIHLNPSLFITLSRALPLCLACFFLLHY